MSAKIAAASLYDALSSAQSSRKPSTISHKVYIFFVYPLLKLQQALFKQRKSTSNTVQIQNGKLNSEHRNTNRHWKPILLAAGKLKHTSILNESTVVNYSDCYIDCAVCNNLLSSIHANGFISFVCRSVIIILVSSWIAPIFWDNFCHSSTSLYIELPFSLTFKYLEYRCPNTVYEIKTVNVAWSEFQWIFCIAIFC